MGDRASDAPTIEDQRAACEAVIASRHGRVGREHDATNESGWTSVDSAPFRAALARCQSGATAGFAIAYADRLARNVRALGRFFDECEATGADIAFADHPDLDYRTDDGRTTTTLDGMMAERKYLADKRRGDRVARMFISERGVANSCAFGYRRNATEFDTRGEPIDSSKTLPERHGKVLVPDADTAPVVRRIFAMRAEGTSWTAMVDALEADGIPGPPRKRRGVITRGHWTASTLRSIVGNEAYRGVARYKALRNEHAHEALVTRAQFDAAQSAVSVSRNGAYAAGLAGGLLRCGSCGGSLSVAGSPGNLTYGCRRQTNGGRCTAPVFVTKAIADAYVEREVLSVISALRGHPSDAGAELARLAEALDTARGDLEGYNTLASAVTPEDFLAGYNVRRTAADAAQDAYDAVLAAASGAEDLPAADEWERYELADKRRVAGMLIERIDVGPRARLVEDRFTIVPR
jgi:DNA invertase Pin-like site-specific DNA recombinase